MNALNTNLTDKLVRFQVDVPGGVKPPYADYIFLCTSGFGCHAETSGGKIFGTFIEDGEETSMRGEAVKEIVEESFLSQHDQERLAKARQVLALRRIALGSRLEVGKVTGTEIDASSEAARKLIYE